MHEAARLRPVVIDESLTDLESLLLARERGYTGVALKACKGQTQAMLMAAAAQKFGMFLCVQDLTCPGASLIHSAGIAARVPGNAGIEANARQFVPSASAPWEARFPGLFTIHDGVMQTGQLTGPGLGRCRRARGEGPLIPAAKCRTSTRQRAHHDQPSLKPRRSAGALAKADGHDATMATMRGTTKASSCSSFHRGHRDVAVIPFGCFSGKRTEAIFVSTHDAWEPACSPDAN